MAGCRLQPPLIGRSLLGSSNARSAKIGRKVPSDRRATGTNGLGTVRNIRLPAKL